MLIYVLAYKSFDYIVYKALKNFDNTDLYEIRIDYLNKKYFKFLKILSNKIKKPIIFTLRMKKHGGLFKGNLKEKLKILKNIKDSKYTYIDFESFTPLKYIKKYKKEFSKSKIILSYHNLKKTPKNLNKIFKKIKNSFIDIYKFVTYSNSNIDNFRILSFLKNNNKNNNIIAFCSGNKGYYSRIISPILGNLATYFSDNKKLDYLNMLNLNDIKNIYHIKKINNKTKVYILIGDPVKDSIGHKFHNQYFIKNKINSVYIKIKVIISELSIFLKFIKKFDFFKGISITMPLKKFINPYIDEYNSKYGYKFSINTIKIKNKKFFATNTDGISVWELIEKKIDVRNKNILILGAGGSAASIAFEGIKKKINLLKIFNRSFNNAKNLVKLITHYSRKKNIYIFNKNTDNEKYEIIISTLPFFCKENVNLINKISTLNKVIFVNIKYSKENFFLNRNIEYINGYKVFKRQAKKQLIYWNLAK